MAPSIQDGDYLLVDRSLAAQHDDIVIAVRDGAFTVKRLFQREDVISLLPDNSDYSPLDLTLGSDFQIWGVVIRVVRVTCRR